eukprot:snap_masked-scaffold2_size2283618-processed-gene-12.36 protein:Tk00062 transcript:snap_masked-scaffold2_size2283618-processed-gene-12.36-mRNA-1 annotation:"lipid-a-disaccharide synthase"
MPYSFDGSLTSSAQTKIEQAIAHWNATTPIRLVPRTSEDDYVNFIDESGCASYIGRIGGAQPIYSSANCSAGNFIHEIGHALGLYHEHTRPDRDTYVEVNWSNISSNRSQNFDIVTSNIQVNTPYDYGSIMHYGKTFFTNNGQETITPKQSNVTIGQRIALSNDDITGINMLYSAGLDVEFGLSPRRPMPDSTLVAEVDLSNSTGGILQSLTATSTLPTGVVFQQASGAGWSCSPSGQSLNCSGPSLQNGASTALELTMQAPNSVSNLDFSFTLAGTSSSGSEKETDVLRTLTMTAVNDPPELEIGQTDVAVIPLSDATRAITRVKAEDPNGHGLSEASGDIHAAAALEALRDKGLSFDCFGMGGSALETFGMELTVDNRDLSVIGFVDVLRNYHKFKRRLEQLRQRLREQRPALLLTVDYPDFNLKLAETARELGIPVLHYVSPTIWAWREGRITRIGQLVTHMAVLFPFEVPYYERHNIPVTYVGHPLLDEIHDDIHQEQAQERLGLAQDKRWSLPITVVKDDSHVVAKACDCIAVASGTATLELALLDRPMVVVYRLNPINYAIMRRLIKIPHISLVNIVAGREVCKELVQSAATPQAIAAELQRLLDDGPYRTAQCAGLLEIRNQMGEPGASGRVAEIMRDLLDDLPHELDGG